MAITNGYTDLDGLKNYMRVTVDTRDGELMDAINDASREIDAYCQRSFYTDTGATRVIPNPLHGNCLPVPDIVHGGITSLKVDTNDDGTYDTTYTEGTDFVVSPASGHIEAGIQFPIDRIIPRTFTFPTRGIHPNRTQIVGDFGWADIPDPIVRGTKALAALRFGQAGAPLGILEGEFGAIRIRDISAIWAMCGPYRRYPLEALVG